MKNMAILGVGNVLEKDDGVAIYATSYLERNYTFSPSVDILNGGVEGVNLLNLFMEYRYILLLDAIEIDDEAGSVYHIPSDELTGYGLNSGGAHEMGVIQCFDILELMGKEIPKSSVLGIVPKEIDVFIGLSEVIAEKFNEYVQTTLKILNDLGVDVARRKEVVSLETIIEEFRNPRSRFFG
mgnify:CR=1 FL=1